MKKFLSLVLALVMTMSLVTIGAGATEYKNLTDKGEIQYEEAVAVLNKLGIITGYEDGSFKPTGALTRGAAAKIIVSLMIGPEAASALTVTAAPYKDVATTNTFAAVISYCKTAGYISGYADGTFRPTGALTGYAFSKMLLGALGYSATVEGFTGSGWTMNVAKLGNKAGLFNDFATAFKGNDGVTREAACLLALNTLKATEVEYVGNTVSVSGKDINVAVGNNQYSYVYSNNTNINSKIHTGVPTSEGLTLEFGEEHFSDLELTTTLSTRDDFGRPASSWSYKHVTVGTYAKTPTFVYTAVVGDSAKDSEGTAKANLGLNGYSSFVANQTYTNGKNNTSTTTGFANLESLTANGYIVEVYASTATADVIDTVVVIKPQLMQVSSVSSKTVSLKQVKSMGTTVTAVQSTDSVYDSLKDLKADDYVMVTVCNGAVDSAYVPTLVTGALTSVYTKTTGAAQAVTVGGTKYSFSKLAELNNTDMTGMSATSVTETKSDIKVYADKFGYAHLLKDVGASDEYLIYADSYQTLVDGKLVWMVKGFDFTGKAVVIKAGTLADANMQYGDIVKYTTTNAPSNGDYLVTETLGYNVSGKYAMDVDQTAPIQSKDTGVARAAGTYVTIASDMKTIFVEFDTDETVKSVTVKNGLANLTVAELQAASSLANSNPAQMYVNKDGAVAAVVVKGESSDAVSSTVLYVKQLVNSEVIDGTKTYTYTAYINGAEETIKSTKLLAAGDFATYVVTGDLYTLSKVTAATSATSVGKMTSVTNTTVVDSINSDLLNLNLDNGIGNTTLKTAGATWVDLTKNGIASGSALKNCADFTGKLLKISVVFNNKASADDEGKVSLIVIDWN